MNNNIFASNADAVGIHKNPMKQFEKNFPSFSLDNLFFVFFCFVKNYRA